MNDLEAARAAAVPIGASVLVLRVFGGAGAELAHDIRQPWPDWVRRLYALEHLADGNVDPEHGAVTLGAAVSATSERLHKRLTVLGFVVSALEQSGWTLALVGDHIVAHRICDPRWARTQLERDGIQGPLTFVATLDEHGFPRLLSHAELS